MSNIHDIIFAVGSIIFIIALIPALKQPPARTTCIITGTILLVYAVNYATLHLTYSLITTAFLGASWLYLATR